MINNKDQFIKDNEGIIRKALAKYPYIPDYDDILQEARIWLLQARKNYDSKKSSWTTYALKYLRYRYCDLIRAKTSRYEKRNNIVTISLEELETIEENKKLGFSLEEKYEANLFYESVLKNIKNDRNREIVKARLDGIGLLELAKKYNVTKSAISLVYCKEMKKIHKLMNE